MNTTCPKCEDGDHVSCVKSAADEFGQKVVCDCASDRHGVLVAKRCKHPVANVKVRTFDREKCWLDVKCELCGQKWCGFGLAWRSRAGKLHKPPEWVKLIVGTLITTDA